MTDTQAPVDEAAVEAAEKITAENTRVSPPGKQSWIGPRHMARIITDAYAEKVKLAISDYEFEHKIRVLLHNRLTAERAVREKLVDVILSVETYNFEDACSDKDYCGCARCTALAEAEKMADGGKVDTAHLPP